MFPLWPSKYNIQFYNLDNLVDMRIKGREETVKKLDWKYISMSYKKLLQEVYEG